MCSNKQDHMINERFGKWTVLNRINNNKPGKHYECICDCGTISIKAGTELRAKRGIQCRECQYAELYDPLREIGNRYGKWKILRFIDVHRKLQRYEAECDCGFVGRHTAADLRAGKSRQCSTCHNRENAAKNVKHGMHAEPIYKIWCAMLHRCNNKNASFYNRYGGRGIKVSDSWHKFENFYKDMGDRPKGLQIDRINNDGDYKPSNCRWVTPKENSNNRSNSKK